MSNTQRTIFISYRQADNPDFVARIRDWLMNKYGRDHVFMDFDSIPPFVKFKDFIKQRVEKSDIVLVVIGERWLELMNEKIKNDDEDYVLVEIQTALALNKTVAPILIKNASMPQRRDLPESVRELGEFNAARLDSGARFYDEIQALVNTLEQALGWQPVYAAQNNNIALAEQYFKQAEKQEESEDYNGALASCNEALRLNPQHAQAWSLRGDVRANMSNFDGAITDYTEALRLDPNFAMAYNNRAMTYVAKGNYYAAIADFNESLRLDPQNALIYCNRGYCYEQINKIVEAVQDYMEYLKLGGGKQYGDHDDIVAKIRKLANL